VLTVEIRIERRCLQGCGTAAIDFVGSTVFLERETRVERRGSGGFYSRLGLERS
jgi:hypothetical protein